ncbi:hypothetical protein KR044_006667 [Drosophila immigrans]|nr:hypothetical protein KR044_006667 [Drosophila immigrans]
MEGDHEITTNSQGSLEFHMALQDDINVSTKLEQLIQLMALKVEVDEQRENRVKIAANGFEKIINEFDGITVPVLKWFENFECNADAYELSEKQKYVQARAKMTGAARLFLESESVCDFKNLKEKLIEEFKCTWNSADIHQLLRDRKKKKSESFHEYTLQMKKLASTGDVEEAAVIRHIVNGLQIKSEYKCAMYRCMTYKALKAEYEIHELTQEPEKKSNEKKNSDSSTVGGTSKDAANKSRKEHCYNCGSPDHKRNECKAEQC